jgi:chitinase
MNPRLASLALLVPILVLADDFRVVGYLPEYRAQQISTTWSEHLTDLILFSAAPSADGQLQTSERLLAIIPRLPRENLRLHICVGGWAKSANFASIAANSETRSRFAHNLLDFCQTHRLQGVDIDWEFPRGDKEVADFAALLRELRNTLQPHGLLLTAAIAQHQTFSPEIYALVDYWHLMSYDHASSPTYAMTVDDINAQRLAGMPRERLCVGIPFYGRGADREAYSFAEIASRHAPAAHIDEIAGIAFNNVDTVRRKTQLARSRRLAGVMIWELGQDSPEHTLLRAISAAAAP